MTPALWIAAALGVLAVLCAGARLIGQRLQQARDAEAREDAAWDALGALIREGRARRARAVTFDMSDADAAHAITLDAVRRRVLGTDRRDEWAA